MTPFDTVRPRHFCRVWLCVALFVSLIPITSARAAMLYKDYVIRYDRGWDILCDPYQIQRGDWVLKIFRQKGEIAHEDFREFLGIFQRLNPHVKDIDRIRPGQVVDIPLKKLAQGHLPGQSSGVVTIPFVMINTPDKVIKKHTNSYTVKRGDTVSTLIARQFGGRYGDDTYQRGLALFKAANPQIEDINRIYAGQKIYMPDPSIREQSWYAGLFDSQGKLVEKMGPDDTDQKQNDAPRAPLPTAAPAAPSTPVDQPPEEGTTGPAADAAAVVGGRLLAKGTYYLPMRQGPEFELDLSRFPMIDMQNGTKVVLTESDRVMETDIASVRSYWDDVKAAQIPENATAEQIIRAVLEALGQDDEANDQLAFNEGGVSISVTAKWIRSRAVNGGVRHICITPISQSGQQTHWAIRRYLDQNDIDIKEILPSGPMPATPQQGMGQPVMETAIDGSSQKAAVASFARLMGFRYSPNTTISFPYAGIQVDAMSNMLSFGNGRDLLIDFGDLYGDAIQAIRDTGLDVFQARAEADPVTLIDQLMAAGGMSSTRAPVFYGANRPATHNVTVTVDGVLIPANGGENLLFSAKRIPELITRFLTDQGIRIVTVSARKAQ